MTDEPEEQRDGNYVICPYCKHKHGDAWEWCDQDGGRFECDECGKTFSAHAEYSVDYISRPIGGGTD